MKQPLLSIVIPTRNRQYYCIEIIKNILSYPNDNIELCIQDNSDNNDIEKFIKNDLKDCRLVYKYVPDPLPSILNMNDAIDLATGKYVIFIGDDDTILPSIFEIVEWADKEGYDSVCSSKFVDYFWPGAVEDSNEGLIIIPNYSGDVKVINVQDVLERLFRNGIVNYLSYNLPKLYHGIILRERLLIIKRMLGRYFQGLSPDISICVSLSTIVKKHIIIDYPITIAGACPMSSTAQSHNHGHRGRLEDAPHLNLYDNYKWNFNIPQFYSVATIWADTAMNTAMLLGRNDLVTSFNYAKLSAWALVTNREIFSYAFKKVLESSPYSIFKLYIKLFYNFFSLFFLFVFHRLRKKNKVKQYVVINKNISEVVAFFLIRIRK